LLTQAALISSKYRGFTYGKWVDRNVKYFCFVNMAPDTPTSLFSQRLKQARLLRGFTLRDLSEKMAPAVSHVSLAKYEKGDVKPSGEILASLCAALGVPPEFMFRPQRVSVDNVSFRKRKSFNEKATATLLENVRAQLENYLEAEEIVGDQVKFENPLKDHPRNGEPAEARRLAQKLRNEWGLGEQPIPSLVELLEKKGVRVIEVDEPSRNFDGCQIEGFDAIAIGKRDDLPVTRKRLTISHEFAHVILNAWGRKLGLFEKDLEKKLINPFASEFLMPSSALKTYFGTDRTSITEKELVDAKLRFGMSICGIVYALHDIGIVGDNAFKRFQMFTVNSWRKDGKVVEPGDEHLDQLYSEEPSRFQRIVLRGISEGNISLSRGAGLLGTDISVLRKEAVPIVE
jgi:Zn-dependent peptidase ImmA (M78 family)/DNA-binding XRE family transcriptional regulator